MLTVQMYKQRATTKGSKEDIGNQMQGADPMLQGVHGESVSVMLDAATFLTLKKSKGKILWKHLNTNSNKKTPKLNKQQQQQHRNTDSVNEKSV